MAKDTAPTSMKGWQEMFDHQRARLLEQTGESLDVWNARIRADTAIQTEADLRAWLEPQQVGGYLRMLLVYERFGYPDFLTLSPDALVEGQYADRPALRPILEKLLKEARKLGPVEVQARKTFVTLVGRRQFAVIKATTRTRVDLALRLDGATPEGRWSAGKSVSDVMSVKVGLGSVKDVDAEVLARLREAWQLNLPKSKG